LGGEDGGFGEIGGGLFGDGGLGGEGGGILEGLLGGEDGGFGGIDGNSTGDGLFGNDLFGSGGTGTPCAACPEGLPEGATDMIVSIEGENGTCADWIIGGSLIFFEDGTDFCNLMKAPIESVCCPEQIKELADPCIICPNGITEGEDSAAGVDESTCGELETTSSMISAGGILCETNKLAAYACCPADASSGSWFGESIEVTNPCTPCPNGAANESALVLYPGEEEEEEYALTCAVQLAQVSSLEEESDLCMFTRTIVQQSCCPEEANPCAICPGGVSDGAVIPGDEEEGETLCSEAVESVMFLDANSETCEMTKGFAAFCCPDDVQLTNPCSICPNGITAVEGLDFKIGGESGEPMTCDLAVTLSNAFDKESEMCLGLSMTQLFCCPDDANAAADPCPFCPGGISADASAIIPDANGLSCSMGIAYAKMVEKSDKMCSDVQMAQFICCPDDFQGAPGETDTAVEEADASITGGSTEASTGGAPDAPSKTDTAVEEVDAASTGDSTEATTGDAVEAPSETDSAVEEVDAASTGDSAEASTGDAAEETATADSTEEPGIDPVDDEQPSVEPPTDSAYGRTRLLGSCVMAVSIAYLL